MDFSSLKSCLESNAYSSSNLNYISVNFSICSDRVPLSKIEYPQATGMFHGASQHKVLHINFDAKL